MHWRKLGRIFNPFEHELPGAGAGFAQSPQAVVFDDFVRIYFSTRAKGADGKFLSQVAFADFMTAMFALFLVLWLVNQSADVKAAIDAAAAALPEGQGR